MFKVSFKDKDAALLMDTYFGDEMRCRSVVDDKCKFYSDKLAEGNPVFAYDVHGILIGQFNPTKCVPLTGQGIRFMKGYNGNYVIQVAGKRVEIDTESLTEGEKKELLNGLANLLSSIVCYMKSN